MVCIDNVYKVVGSLAALATSISVIWALKTYIFNKKVLKVQKSIDLLKYYKDNILRLGYAIRYVNEKSKMNDELSNIKISEESLFNNQELSRFKIDVNAVDNIYHSKEFMQAIFEANNLYDLKLPVKIVSKNEDKNSKQVCAIFDMYPTCKSFIENVVYETLNNIEYFAAHFKHGVADDTVAYNSLHQTYIPLIESLYYQIAQTNKEVADSYYTNAIYLYKLWKQKQKMAYCKSDEISKKIGNKSTIVK